MAQLGSGNDSDYGTGVIDTKQTYANGSVVKADDNTRIDAEFCNDVLAAIIAIQTILGATPQGIFGSVQARLNVISPSTGLLINVQTGTTYTVLAEDNNKMITFTNAATVTVTLPETDTEDIAEGFQVLLVQRGTGQVVIDVEGTDVLESRNDETKLMGQHSAATVIKLVAGDPNTWGLYGDTTE